MLASVGMGRAGLADCQSTVSNNAMPLDIMSSWNEPTPAVSIVTGNNDEQDRLV